MQWKASNMKIHVLSLDNKHFTKGINLVYRTLIKSLTKFSINCISWNFYGIDLDNLVLHTLWFPPCQEVKRTHRSVGCIHPNKLHSGYQKILFSQREILAKGNYTQHKCLVFSLELFLLFLGKNKTYLETRCVISYWAFSHFPQNLCLLFHLIYRVCCAKNGMEITYNNQ